MFKMKQTALAIVALMIAALLAAIAPASAQPAPSVSQSWWPQGRTSLSVSGTTGNVAFPASGFIANICNTGANDAFISFGTANTVAATTAAGYQLKAGFCQSYARQAFGTLYTYLAGITSTSTTTLYIETGTGTPFNLPIGTAALLGTVTANQGGAPWSDNVTQWASTNVGTPQANNADGVAAVTAGAPPFNAYSFLWNGATFDRWYGDKTSGAWVNIKAGSIANTSFGATQGTSPWIVAGGGTAGSAATGVATVQGIASMTPFLVNPGTAANWNVDWAGGVLGAMANYGTSPGAVLVPGVNAFVTNSLPAGTNIIGSLITQGYSVALSVTRTADTNAYTANDVLGTGTGSAGASLTFANIGPSAGGEVLITTAKLEYDVTAIPSGMTSFRLYLYNLTPPSALGDNAAFDLPSGDRASFAGYVDLGSPVDLGSTLYVETSGINKQVKVPSGGSLYGYLVTNGAYTPGSADVLKITLHATGL